jgi:hypothetical protein
MATRPEQFTTHHNIEQIRCNVMFNSSHPSTARKSFVRSPGWCLQECRRLLTS